MCYIKLSIINLLMYCFYSELLECIKDGQWTVVNITTLLRLGNMRCNATTPKFKPTHSYKFDFNIVIRQLPSDGRVLKYIAVKIEEGSSFLSKLLYSHCTHISLF